VLLLKLLQSLFQLEHRKKLFSFQKVPYYLRTWSGTSGCFLSDTDLSSRKERFKKFRSALSGLDCVNMSVTENGTVQIVPKLLKVHISKLNIEQNAICKYVVNIHTSMQLGKLLTSKQNKDK
jgi:hypothetical protein